MVPAYSVRIQHLIFVGIVVIPTGEKRKKVQMRKILESVFFLIRGMHVMFFIVV